MKTISKKIILLLLICFSLAWFTVGNNTEVRAEDPTCVIVPQATKTTGSDGEDVSTYLFTETDRDLFSATCQKNDGGGAFYASTSNNTFRFYGPQKDKTTGQQITIVVKETANISITQVGIKFSSTTNSDIAILSSQTINGDLNTESTIKKENMSASQTTVPVSAGTKKIAIRATTVTTTTSSLQTHVSKIELTYTSTTSTPQVITDFEALTTKAGMKFSYTDNADDTLSLVVGSPALRFGTTITKTMYDALVAAGVTEFGVDIEDEEFTTNPVRVNAEGDTEEDVNGNYYQFALVLTGIPLDELDVSVTAKVYVKIGTEYYYMKEVERSFVSQAQAYLDSELPAVVDYEDILQHIVNTYGGN